MFLSSLRQRANLDGKTKLERTAKDKSRWRKRPKSNQVMAAWRVMESVRQTRRIRWKHILVVVLIAMIIVSSVMMPLITSFQEMYSFLRVSDKQLFRQYKLEAHTTRIKELRDLGIELPMLDIRSIPTKALSSPFGLLAETLIRTVRRKRQLQRATKWVNATWNDACRRHRRAAVITTTTTMSSSDWPTSSSSSSIPPWILQPNHGKYYRPLYQMPPTMQVISFDEANMRMFLQEHFPKSILKQYDSALHPETKINIWRWCSLYQLGGIVMGSRVRQVVPLLEQLPTKGDCEDDAIALLEPVESHPNTMDLAMFAVSPRHALARCVIDRQGWNMLDALRDLFSIESKTRSALPDPEQRRDIWKNLATPCSTATSGDCCMDVIQNITAKVVSVNKVQQQDEQPNLALGRLATVAKGKRSSKSSNKRGAGFFCNRCLRNPRYGSFDACVYSCGSYVELQCDKPSDHEDDTTSITIETLQKSANVSIPKIIHQTWSELLEPHRNPELARLQNAWKHSGYDCRFYTVEDARLYVASHFHQRILEAYDAINMPVKLDLFRLLLLLREGGIYADMDVMLDINLDFFLVPTISFFAPRDVNEDLTGDDFCLWNGFMGASPGHPIMARAVERMFNMILKRAQYCDMEQEACRTVGRSLNAWKMRAVPSSSILSGSCSLGMAVNEVLGTKDVLSKFEPGWITRNDRPYDDFGDVLVLMADQEDMGSFRFSDIDRNLIVASTNLIGLNKRELESFPIRTHHIRMSDVSAVQDVVSLSAYKDGSVVGNAVKLVVVTAETKETS